MQSSERPALPPQAAPAAGPSASGGTAPAAPAGNGGGLFSGLLLGMAAYVLYLNRAKVMARLGQLPFLAKHKQ